MFRKILIANRGDIAVSIIRSCRELDIKTVAVFSTADLESLHANLADESYCIGPADLSKSYCNVDIILCTAVLSGADAIYVGYGFLAESAELSRRCAEAGITFIGAAPGLLDLLADEAAVKALMKEAGIPTNEKKLHGAPKQIDIQLVCDNSGTVLIAGERDSSYKHNSTRLIGESPSGAMSEKTRKKLYKASRRIVEALKFVGIGSANFYIDRDGNYSFARFVPRLQVGCAITETHSRINLTKWQIRIAAGENLTFTESELNTRGHTIGCRIYAVHPVTQMPSAGQISILHVPGGVGVRFDTACYQNYRIPVEYEPMLAKLIIHASSREEAIRKMKNALRELVTEGIHNNSEIFKEIMETDDFITGDYDITSYDRFMCTRTEY